MIRSVIVPVANVASNVLQLMTLGVPLRDIQDGFKTKLVEINQHLANEARRVEIGAEMAQVKKGSVPYTKLEAELKSLDDANRRMTIWPLIEAGEFSTISEGLTEADAAIGQGQWAEWMQEKLEAIPQKLGTVGRYAMVTRDTALFQGMSRAVQYGDFLGKAVAYEHLVKTRKQTPEQAMRRITEMFVNYNFLPGRARSYAESMGLTWFWAFKLRSIKEAHRILRDNPLRALLTTVGAGALPDIPGISIGSPVTDNFLTVAGEGRLGYSVGPGMLFNAPSLNPWVQLYI